MKYFYKQDKEFLSNFSMFFIIRFLLEAHLLYIYKSKYAILISARHTTIVKYLEYKHTLVVCIASNFSLLSMLLLYEQYKILAPKASRISNFEGKELVSKYSKNIPKYLIFNNKIASLKPPFDLTKLLYNG